MTRGHSRVPLSISGSLTPNTDNLTHTVLGIKYGLWRVFYTSVCRVTPGIFMLSPYIQGLGQGLACGRSIYWMEKSAL